MNYQFNMPPEWIRTSTLEAAKNGKGASTLMVNKTVAAAVYRLLQLANVAAQGTAPAVARVDLRTWAVTLETSEEEQARAFEFIPPPGLRSLHSTMKIGDMLIVRGDFGDGLVIKHYRISNNRQLERIPDDEWEAMNTKARVAPAPD